MGVKVGTECVCYYDMYDDTSLIRYVVTIIFTGKAWSVSIRIKGDIPTSTFKCYLRR